MDYTAKEIFEAFGGNHASVGFWFVFAVVAIFYLVKTSRDQRGRRTSKDRDVRDIDEGIDF